MLFTEKLIYLRNLHSYSREKLAELCDVSPQAVAKWESGENTPKPDKLVHISQIFGVSLDTLLKDELAVGKIKPSPCSSNVIVDKRNAPIYEGILIKESLEDDSIIGIMNIHKIELWETDDIPRYWTALTFSSNDIDFPQKISKVLIDRSDSQGNWFLDFKHNNTKYVVLKNTVLKYEIGDLTSREQVTSICKSKGIPDHQMNWSE